MGRYRSTSQFALIEQHFPIRLRIEVPPMGLGKELDRLHGWLREVVGPHGYGFTPGDIGMVHYTCLHLPNRAVLRHFLNEWGAPLKIDLPEIPREKLR